MALSFIDTTISILTTTAAPTSTTQPSTLAYNGTEDGDTYGNYSSTSSNTTLMSTTTTTTLPTISTTIGNISDVDESSSTGSTTTDIVYTTTTGLDTYTIVLIVVIVGVIVTFVMSVISAAALCPSCFTSAGGHQRSTRRQSRAFWVRNKDVDLDSINDSPTHLQSYTINHNGQHLTLPNSLKELTTYKGSNRDLSNRDRSDSVAINPKANHPLSNSNTNKWRLMSTVLTVDTSDDYFGGSSTPRDVYLNSKQKQSGLHISFVDV